MSVAFGCKATISGPGGTKGDDTGPTDGGPDWTPSDDTGDTGDTGDDDDDDNHIDPIVYDCDALPEVFTEVRQVEGARGYHGLVFDDEDRIVGWDARSAIVAASSDGESDVFVPGMQSVEQMVRDDEGNIYFVHSWEGAVYKIYPSGGTELVANGFDYSYPYGLFWGPDGHLYVVDGRVVRLNIETLEVTEILVPPGSGAWMAHAANFSLDSTALFVATVGNGDVLRVPLDENLDPAGEYEVFSNTPGGWQDSVGVDACGNLYIPEYYTGSLFRISPDGESKRVLEGRERDYGHGVVWGTGDGGWRRDAIYMPKPYDNTSVKEVVVGVPDGSLVRTWNGERVER